MREGKACNACVTFINLMVVNDYGSLRRDLIRRLIYRTTLLSWNLNRIVLPRTGLIRPMRSNPYSGFWVNLSEEGISVKRSLPGHSREQIKEDNFPRAAGHG
jgi:hypothetical protein